MLFLRKSMEKQSVKDPCKWQAGYEIYLAFIKRY